MANVITIEKAMGDMKVAHGDTENVVDAVLRDVAYGVKRSIEAQWPIDTGDSLAGFEVSSPDPGKWILTNDMDYVPEVWDDPAHGGPPALIERLVDQAIDPDKLSELISERILALLK